MTDILSAADVALLVSEFCQRAPDREYSQHTFSV